MSDPIKGAMIRTLILQIRSQTGAGVVVASYMIGTAWAFNPPALVIAWGTVMLLAVAARWAIGHAFKREQRADVSLDRWGTFYALAMAAIGAMYGIAFLLFAHPDEPVTIALTLAALYSVAAGSTPSSAYHPPAILGAVVPAFGAVLGKLLLTGDFEYVLLGVASALYGLTMIGYCQVQSQTLKEGFRIRFENVELVEQLRRETEAADEARRAAEAANLAKSQFLAAASHDLRQPLYALGLFSSSLEEMRLDSSGRDVVRRIQDSIGAMESSFEGLLDLSKLEAGVVKPRFEPVDVNALFDRVGQIFRPLAIERGLDLRLRSDGERVTGDPALLEQVISNLVANAVRATNRGGILIAARRRREMVSFEIWDTGKGIAPADLHRIFDDYVQLSNPERDRSRGLGLGLAIARRSIALLASHITVASRLGRGSRFAFDLPMCNDVPVQANGGAGSVSILRRGGDLPLLVVEDNEDVRIALTDLLARWGFPFEAVADAKDGLAQLRAGREFSLVITDQRLSGALTGLDLIRAMRAELADPPPAIIVTGEVDSPLLQSAEADGVIVLHKPVQAARLRRLLGGSPARDSAAAIRA
jgi:signal transduction histidine kinase/CheY-like chemotaxis protein